jgi:hypothetical protein
MNVVIQVIVRHALSAIGFTGVVSDDEMKQIAGAVVTLLMIAWSLWSKRQQIREASRVEEVR